MLQVFAKGAMGFSDSLIGECKFDLEAPWFTGDAETKLATFVGGPFSLQIAERFIIQVGFLVAWWVQPEAFWLPPAEFSSSLHAAEQLFCATFEKPFCIVSVKPMNSKDI